jgi:hypothetical protein
MTTAEKRAELEARGEAWPDCECHISPMFWQRDPRLPARGRFVCRVAKMAYQTKKRQRRRQSGLCIHCGAPAISDVCEEHHIARADSSRRYYESPKGRMVKARQLTRRSGRRRASEGFQSTRAGRAAIAAYFTTRGGDDVSQGTEARTRPTSNGTTYVGG